MSPVDKCTFAQASSRIPLPHYEGGFKVVSFIRPDDTTPKRGISEFYAAHLRTSVSSLLLITMTKYEVLQNSQ